MNDDAVQSKCPECGRLVAFTTLHGLTGAVVYHHVGPVRMGDVCYSRD